MNPATPDGLVAQLWRFPVKSMAGDALGEAIFTDQGVLGDRAFALVDLETSAVVSASNKHFPGMLDCRATFLVPPQADADLPPVRITLPDGTSCTSDSPDSGTRLSAYFRRDVILVHARPDSYARKQAAFFASVGLDNSSPSDSLVDFCPVSVITTATLSMLNEVRPNSQFDTRRFRMNVVVTAEASGFVENRWVGRGLTVGNDLRLAVIMPDPRCVITTLPQGDLQKDPAVLRTLAEQNTLPIGSGAPYPCAGVYATVAKPGVVRVNDSIFVTGP